MKLCKIIVETSTFEQAVCLFSNWFQKTVAYFIHVHTDFLDAFLDCYTIFFLHINFDVFGKC